MKVTLERMASLLLCTVCALFALSVFVKYLLPIVMPFALAYVCALATKGTSDKMHRKTGIPAPFLRLSLLLSFLTVLSGICFFFGFRIVNEAQELLVHMGNNPSVLEKLFSSVRDCLHTLFARIDANGVLENAFASLLRDGVSTVFSLLADTVKGALVAIPRALVFLVITLIAALYFALDLHRVHASLAELCPLSVRRRIRRVLESLKSCLLRYVRAYALLSALTFLSLLVGLWLIGVRYTLLVAALLTLLDLLPVFGVGTALIPWGIYEIAVGHAERGFALLLLFALLFVARQIAEPKIVGAQMGLHPLLSLFFTYAGLRLFGVAGMIFAPIIAAIVRDLLTDEKGAKE